MRILYYALVVRHPQISPLPLAEMLTNDHTNVEITHFLSKRSYNLKKVLNKETTISQVEVDFSWPMLHSVCNCFNTQSLDLYLKIVGNCITKRHKNTSKKYSYTNMFCKHHAPL